ncbi:MAG TPA: LuxR C-terminal-related transcriptional regulator [Amycolatopsis sp.]|nr:LuxR C-terminal-related transcriptional regulator [Amycolatopsis sp.]
MPEPPPGLVSRQRLLATLDSHPGAPVALVCAPAGSGKTLLLAQWARRRGEDSVAWVSLDPDDNSDRRFWSAILDALCARVAADNGLQGLAVPADPSSRPEFIGQVVDGLGRLPVPLWLVLDDLHEITSPEPIAGLLELLRHQPPMLRLVLSTRRDPGLPLARLRLDDWLTEVRARDLLFSEDEARQMLTEMGLALSGDQVRELVARTEGWAAGLRLAGMSLSTTTDPGGFLTDFARNDQAMGEFLLGEVLARMPEDTRRFVRAISICGEVSADLAGALSGRPDAGAMLAELEQRASLAVKVGGRGDWYRMHALLRAHVLLDLHTREPALAAELEALAADWFAAHGEPLRALDHASAARDERQTVALLRRHAVDGLLAGEHGVLHRAMGVLRPERLVNDSLLALISACLHLVDGEPRAAEIELSMAEGAWPARPAPDLETLLRLTRARLAQVTGDIDDMVRTTETLGEETGRSRRLDPPVLLQLGAAAFVAGENASAVERISAALERARAAGQGYVATQCLMLLSGLSAAEGAFQDMTRLAAEAVAENTERGWDTGIEAAGAHALLAFGALVRADPAQCEHQAGLAESILEVAPPDTGQAARLFAGVLRGTAEFDQGARGAGARRILAARAQAGPTRLPPSQVALSAFLAHRAATALGWTDVAAETVRWCETELPGSGEITLMRVRGQLALGHHAAAAATLRALPGDATAMTLPWSGIWAALAEVEIAAHEGEPDRAHRAVSRALTLAAPQNVRYPLVFGAPAVVEALAAGLGRFGPIEDFAREIVAVRDRLDVPPDPAILTTRERDVLRLLPTQRSFEEIAEDLTVSPNTVKTHARTLYGKLGVSRRREAVDVAREQGLLEDSG